MIKILISLLRDMIFEMGLDTEIQDNLLRKVDKLEERVLFDY